MKTLEKTVEKTAKKKTSKPEIEKADILAKSGIKPRGLWGWMEGKIHYDKDEDIFNLGPL
jgi:hypothetical protein